MYIYMGVYDGLRFELTCSSAESYMYLCITSRGNCSTVPPAIHTVKVIYSPLYLNYEDYTIFSCCAKLTSTQMWPIMDMA